MRTVTRGANHIALKGGGWPSSNLPYAVTSLPKVTKAPFALAIMDRSNTLTVERLLHSYAERMRSSLREDVIPHPGELGTGREEVVREFFRRYLPTRFGVATGFIFDSTGAVSDQCDIVIYDKQVCPEFEAAGGKRFFPCEAVVCVGQVKSVLTSRKEVLAALENLRSIKVLDRSSGGESYSTRDRHLLDPASRHLDQIFSFLLVLGRSAASRTMRGSLTTYLEHNPRGVWPNVVFALDRYLLSYFCEDGVCPNPMHALGFSETSSGCSNAEMLLRFYTLVARAVEATHVAPFPYWEYLDGGRIWNMSLEPFEQSSSMPPPTDG